MHSTMASSTASESSLSSCSSTPSQPIQIGFNPTSRPGSSYDACSYSSNASTFSTMSTCSTTSSGASPYGSSVLQRRAASSYFSDAELFGDDSSPFLEEAPAPPRGAEAWLAQARAQGHAPPMANERPLPIPIQRSSSKREARPSMLSNAILCSAD